MTRLDTCPAEKIEGRHDLIDALADRGVIAVFQRRFNANYDFEDDEPAEDFFLGYERNSAFSHEEILITATHLSHAVRVSPLIGREGEKLTEYPHIPGGAGLRIDPAAIKAVVERSALIAPGIARQLRILDTMTWTKAVQLSADDTTRAVAYATAALRQALRMRHPCARSKPYSEHDLASLAPCHLTALIENPHVRIVDTLDDAWSGKPIVAVELSTHRLIERIGADLPANVSIDDSGNYPTAATSIEPTTFDDFYTKVAAVSSTLTGLAGVYYEGFDYPADGPVELRYGT